MIWGETTKQMLDRIYKSRKWFAWYPVKLEDGRWIWWEYIWRVKREYRGGSEMIYTLQDKK